VCSRVSNESRGGKVVRATRDDPRHRDERDLRLHVTTLFKPQRLSLFNMRYSDGLLAACGKRREQGIDFTAISSYHKAESPRFFVEVAADAVKRCAANGDVDDRLDGRFAKAGESSARAAFTMTLMARSG
jgi:hypothetical protein